MSAPTFNKNLAGLLVPVFALRHANDFGIGDTLAMKEAVTFCKENRLAVLQTLPIHETIGDHSPYNPISSRALSPACWTSLQPMYRGSRTACSATSHRVPGWHNSAKGQ